MVVGDHRTASGRVSAPTFLSPEAIVVGETITLGEDAAHHMRVLRLDVGAPVQLLDGLGAFGAGTLVRLAKRNASVHVETAVHADPLPPVHVVVPIADRDRMLWLAEKMAELGATSWRPVMFKRSRSVTPRGEGTVFHHKVTARMSSALEQSRGAWLPQLYPEATLENAIAATPNGVRLVLDGSGAAVVPSLMALLAAARGSVPAGGLVPVTVVVGPEGGLESAELQLLRDSGFRAVTLGRTVLRFETAAVAGLAVVRAALDASASPSPSAAVETPDA